MITKIKQLWSCVLLSNIVLLSAVTLMSCASDEDFYYQDTPRIRLVGPSMWTAGTDSLTYSFVAYGEETTQVTFDIDAYIMGPVANADRTAALTVDNARTSASADLYVVPQTVVVPAGKNHGTFTVTLKRSQALKNQAVTLRVNVGESADFKTGVNEENHLTFIWTDKLSKPSNWAELEEFFGQYSDVKYRFMLENCEPGTSFSADTMTWAQLMSYRIKFQNALNDYNAAHPGSPLTDENGVLVTF